MNNKLFPALKPYVQHQVAVDAPHVLHVEECGNPSGVPVLFLHGGPGAGIEPGHRQFFDPDVYRIVLFDQRGSGQSTPHASLEGNNSQALIADIEVIRKHLGIDQWLLFGGSWGATLALLYAQAHAQRVSGLILRGIFLCRRQDIDWFYEDGASHIFPDHWQDFLQPIAGHDQGRNIEAYYQRLTGQDELARLAAAKAWSKWEARCATLRPSGRVISGLTQAHVALSMARIECHYFINDCFIKHNQILDNIEAIQDIPGIIVHGRYDMVCPVEQAVDLHHAWPESHLNIIPDAGHSAFEPGIIHSLIAATRSFGDMLS